MYDGKNDKSFIDWITQVEKIAKLTQCPEVQLAQAKAEGIVYKCMEGMPQSSILDTVKKKLCQVFSLVATECMQPPEYILDPYLLMRLYRKIFKDSLI